jgi:glucose/arabinose dehydrogenase
MERNIVVKQISLLMILVILLAGCGQVGEEPQAESPAPAETGTDADASPAAESPEPAATPDAPQPPSETPETEATPDPETGEAFDPEQVTLDLEEVASGFDQPLFVTHAGDGSGRTFVVERGGTIRFLSDREVFLDISDRVESGGFEQGLLGLAFHPSFSENRYFYVNYTGQGGDTVVSRFSVNEDGSAGDPNSEQIILQQEQPAANHNGGMIEFGPDGYLYIGLGDGGGANDQYGNGQNTETWLGTLLRIDVDGEEPYAVPEDNPFVDDPNVRPEIWAYGLRNPWRFSFDRDTDDLYIADVGQNQFEWVHFRPAGDQGGENYGWPIVEGSHCFQSEDCDKTGLVLPVAEYDHSLGCTIIGGYVYRGEAYPELRGAYLFGDFCSGRIWTLSQDAQGNWLTTEMLQADAQISSFGEDEAGEMYVTDLNGGVVYRVVVQ